MNLLMAGMVVPASQFRLWIAGGDDPMRPGFWFMMSMALSAGFIVAYPMNWWLVGKGLKHGMLTVREGQQFSPGDGMKHEKDQEPSVTSIAGMIAFSILSLVLGTAVSRILRA